MGRTKVINNSSENYYDRIANGYDELHGEEQLKKYDLVLRNYEFKQDDKLLDVGCGSGIVTDKIPCKIVVGVDPSKKLLEIAKKRSNKKYLLAKAEDLPFKDKEFDTVISFTAIQNFDDLKKGLEEIKRVGKRDYILTFLKKSDKKEAITKIINELFNIKKTVEEDKDIIIFAKKR